LSIFLLSWFVLTRNTIWDFFFGGRRVREKKGSPFRVAEKGVSMGDGADVLTIQRALEM
jgi:hypothetical protein